MLRGRPAQLLALVLACTAAVANGGCGDSERIPPNVVAMVGGTAITQGEFDAMAARAPRGAMMASAASQPTYDPPDFSRCVASKRANAPVATSQEPLPERELKKLCEREFQRAKDSVLPSMIFTEWLRQEARRLEVSVPRAQLERRLAAYFKDEDTGQDVSSELLKGPDGKALVGQVRDQLLEQGLLEKARARAGKITESELRRYYERNRRQFVSAERRDVRLVMARDRQAAEKAKQALEEGASWATVVARHSIDEASKSRDGRLRLTAGERGDPALVRAAFAAPTGGIMGPTESQFGWYVFTVASVGRERSESFAEARERIGRRLRARREKTLAGELDRTLYARYQEQTSCASEFEVSLCRD